MKTSTQQQALTMVEVQQYIRQQIGLMSNGRRCSAAAIEFGSEGFGVIRTAWESGRGGIRRQSKEFDSLTELAAIVRRG